MRRRKITLKLARRSDGSYCKWINNKMYYFGRAGGTHDEAERELIEFIRQRHQGEMPVKFRPQMTVAELASRYAEDREPKVGRTTWFQYFLAIRDFVGIVGRDTPIGALNASHFEAVARNWRERYRGNPFNNRVQYVRTMFKWAEDRLIIERVPRYGPAFKKMSAAAVRETQRNADERPFTGEEIDKILAAASPKIRLFFLLGLNGGMYSADIASLKWGDIRHEAGVLLIDNRRIKKGVRRRVPLWPEVARDIERMTRGGANDLVFTTSHGNPWHNRAGTDSIGLMFRRLADKLGIRREGVGFGSVRHTHISAVGDNSDEGAKSYVVGHLIQGIKRHYDRPSVERCKVVTDLARARLLFRNASALAAILRRKVGSSRTRKPSGRPSPSGRRRTSRRQNAAAAA